MDNPLKRPILEVLQNNAAPIKEYQLHDLLGGEAFAEFTQDCSYDLALFRKHFLMMNALYQLHEELREQDIYLHISALNIQIQKLSKTETTALSNDSGFEKLSGYYRDWNNFNQTDDEGVAQLLDQFWKKYLAFEEQGEALICLELQQGVSWEDIQQQYRRLCRQHHPDKGGDTIKFINIRQAYENLKRVYNT